MTEVLEWAESLWDERYSFNYKVNYDEIAIMRTLRRNLTPGKDNLDIEFSILGDSSEKKLKGSVSSVTSSLHGVTQRFNGYYEIRFSQLLEKQNNGWIPFLDEKIEIDYNELIPSKSKSVSGTKPKMVASGIENSELFRFVVLRIGFNPNIKSSERFECNFTQFFWKLMNSVTFNINEWGKYEPLHSEIVSF